MSLSELYVLESDFVLFYMYIKLLFNKIWLFIMSCKRKRKNYSSIKKRSSIKYHSTHNNNFTQPQLNIDGISDNYEIRMILNQEKKDECGEDSDPLMYQNGITGFLGVFDGMGGAGATEYTLPSGCKRTGAYLASRLVCQSIYEYVEQDSSCDIDSVALQKFIKNKLDKYVSDYNIKPSGLRSSLIRILPTTMSFIGYQKNNDFFDVYSYWCGDSRNYFLTLDGLKQISVDDLKSGFDPLQNLRNDDVISNCICQDRDFTVNKCHVGHIDKPVILISATDGCFGYLQTPMHFEYLLLETLVDARNEEDWKINIMDALKPVSGDDFSMAVVMLGLTFEQWKNILSKRLQLIKSEYIQPLERISMNIERYENQIQDQKQKLYDCTTSLWEKYKADYLNK